MLIVFLHYTHYLFVQLDLADEQAAAISTIFKINLNIILIVLLSMVINYLVFQLDLAVIRAILKIILNIIIIIISIMLMNHYTHYLVVQLDLADEQAAAIRRELDARREKVHEMENVRAIFFSSSVIEAFIDSLIT